MAKSTCAVDACERPHYALGFCNPHWNRHHRGGDMAAPVKSWRESCTISGCDRRHAGRGLCTAHLRRVGTHGDPLASVPIGPYGRPAEVRFWEKVDRQGPNDCWPWQGSIARGYGKFRVGKGTTHLAHRFAYEALVGAIPSGMQMDHVCHSRDAGCDGAGSCVHRRCVNPAHLEVVTASTNSWRRERGMSA